MPLGLWSGHAGICSCNGPQPRLEMLLDALVEAAGRGDEPYVAAIQSVLKAFVYLMDERESVSGPPDSQSTPALRAVAFGSPDHCSLRLRSR